jgi:hypothetical protein
MSITKTQARKIAVETFARIAQSGGAHEELHAATALMTWVDPNWQEGSWIPVLMGDGPEDSPADEEGA